MSDWRPSAALSALAERAALLQQLRSFFRQRGIMELETLVLSLGTVPDPGIEVFSLPSDDAGGPKRYLQTSPEFAMKRLLAAGAGDIFQIVKAFRQGESGRHHNPEFTLLEWYRVGWNHAALIREVAEMVSEVLTCRGWQVWPYRTLFQVLLDIDPFQEQADLSHWLAVARARIGDVPDELDRDALLDLLMSHRIDIDDEHEGQVLLQHLDAGAGPPAEDATTIDVGARPAGAAALDILWHLLPASRRPTRHAPASHRPSSI